MNRPIGGILTNRLMGGFPPNEGFPGFRLNPLYSGLFLSVVFHLSVFGVAMGVIAWGEAHAEYRIDVDQSNAPLLTLEAKHITPPLPWVLAKKMKMPPLKVQPTPTPEPEGAVVASRQPSWVDGMIGEDDYPVQMRKDKKEGRVIAEILIDITGSVRAVNILQGADPAFNSVVLEKLKTAKFQPALDKQGQPMNCRVRIPISFKLD